MRSLGSVLSAFGFPLAVLIGGLGLAACAAGLDGLYVVGALAVLEVALSFDNAIINATLLRRLPAFWQLMFLTVGLVVAVIGMRLVFPVALVAVSAHLSLGSVIDLALHNPAQYARELDAARPEIAAFGAAFLMMLFLDFVFDETKQVHWIGLVERPLAAAGRWRVLPVVLVLVGLGCSAAFLAGPDAGRVLRAGVAGLIVYLGVRWLLRVFANLGGRVAGQGVVNGASALVLFGYLLVLDSAFSFDSVVGAFAISTNVLMIALGLTIGAVFVRELTLWLVRRRALDQFVYLEHGAQYSVGALAVILALGLAYDVPDAVTGTVGAGIIALALHSSIRENQRANRAHHKANNKYRSAP